MKVYFTASVRGVGEYGENYRKIFDALVAMGGEQVDDFLVSDEARRKKFRSYEEQVELWRWVNDCIRQADLVVLELSVPSLSMGFIIREALERNKPVLGMYLPDHEPSIVMGVTNQRLKLLEYSMADVEEKLVEVVREMVDLTEHRMTVIMPSDIMKRLNEVAEKGTNKSDYIRELIRKDMGSGRS